MKRWALGDEGTTLIEVLIAVIIMGSAIVALLGGFTTAIFGSVTHRTHGKIATVIREYAETIESGGFFNCASPTPSPLVEDSYTASVTGRAYWVPPPTPSASSTATFSPCIAASPTPTSGVVRVSVKTVSPDGKISESLDVYVRK